MKKLIKLFKSYTFNIIFALSITGFVLWITLKDNYRQVFQILTHANILWILFTIGLVLFYHGMIGLVLKMLVNISNPNYRWHQGLVNALVASFFHGVTPGQSGGQFAQVYVFKKQGIAMSDSASALWMEFIVYQSTMVLSVLLLLVLRFTYFYQNHSQFFVLVLVGFLVNASVIAGLYVLVRYPRIYRWLTTSGIQIGSKLHIIKEPDKTIEKIDNYLGRFDKEIKKFHDNRALVIKLVIANLIRLLCYYSIPFFATKALHIPVEITKFIDILALSAYVAMINCFIPIPGASGGTEATFILMFSTFFSSSEATSIMILWRFISFYFVMIVGGLTFLLFKMIPSKEKE